MINNEIIIKKEENENYDNYENYTIIEINGKLYGFKTFDVLGITKLMELDYPNNLPSYILGMIKYEKNPVGVIDILEVFKEKRKIYDLSAKIIILKTQNAELPYCSIICDNVLDIKKIDKKDIKPVPYQNHVDFFSGIFIENHQFIDKEDNIYLLNISNIINYTNKHPDLFIGDNNKYLVDDENSIEILKNRKDFLEKIEQDIQEISPIFDMGITFRIGQSKYYIDMTSVREFYKVNNTKFIAVPNTPEYIFGLLNVKGEYITVVDIKNLLHNSKTELEEKSTIIILNSNEFKIGILADEILQSMNIDFEEITKNKQKREDTNFLEFVKDGEMYQIIDINELLEDDRLTIC